ncbi:bifunctional OB-fold nucleic acid binding domain-containing protein/MaoC family dehydratase [Shewanella halifaxensis]|nr:OB-fold domain-containing protein [Shewanella halifaxensis]
MMSSFKPLPLATKISTPFWQALKEQSIQLQQCNSCDGWVFFPRNHCSHCLAHDLTWKPVSGEATLYTYTVARVPTMAEFSDESPQILAVVTLKEGVRMNTTLVGLQEEDIKVGMHLKPVFDKVDAKGNTLLRFTGVDSDLSVLEYQDPLVNLPKNSQGQVQVPINNLTALNALVTDDFSPWSEPLTVDQGLINAFADLSGDDYWIHTDPEKAAKESPFGTTIAHGSLVQVLQSRLPLTLPYEIVGFNTMVNYGSDRLRFPTPVPAGAKIQSRARVKSVASTHKGLQLILEVHIHLVDNDRPSVINELVIFYR